MGIVHGNLVLGLRIRPDLLSSPSGVVEVEVSKYNMVNRGILEQKMEQRKYIFCNRGDRKSIRKVGDSRLGANWSVNVVDDNISSTIHRAPKTQKTVIRARKIPSPRARVHALVYEKADARVWHRRVEKMKGNVGGAMCG